MHVWFYISKQLMFLVVFCFSDFLFWDILDLEKSCKNSTEETIPITFRPPVLTNHDKIIKTKKLTLVQYY